MLSNTAGVVVSQSHQRTDIKTLPWEVFPSEMQKPILDFLVNDEGRERLGSFYNTDIWLLSFRVVSLWIKGAEHFDCCVKKIFFDWPVKCLIYLECRPSVFFVFWVSEYFSLSYMQKGQRQKREADRLSLQAQGVYVETTTMGLNIKT